MPAGPADEGAAGGRRAPSSVRGIGESAHDARARRQKDLAGRAQGAAPAARRVRKETAMILANWLSQEWIRAAGSALLHFLWQGTAAAALAAVTMTLFRRASARYLVAVGGLVL